MATTESDMTVGCDWISLRNHFLFIVRKQIKLRSKLGWNHWLFPHQNPFWPGTIIVRANYTHYNFEIPLLWSNLCSITYHHLLLIVLAFLLWDDLEWSVDTMYMYKTPNNTIIWCKWKTLINYWTRSSKILWFVGGEQINYLPMLKAEANNYWSASHQQITIFCENWVQ